MATPREQPHGNPKHGGLGWAGDNLIWNGVGWSKKKKLFSLDRGGNGLYSCPLAGLAVNLMQYGYTLNLHPTPGYAKAHRKVAELHIYYPLFSCLQNSKIL